MKKPLKHINSVVRALILLIAIVAAMQALSPENTEYFRVIFVICLTVSLLDYVLKGSIVQSINDILSRNNISNITRSLLVMITMCCLMIILFMNYTTRLINVLFPPPPSSLQKQASLVNCPGTDPQCQQAVTPLLPSGTIVTIICYQDGATAFGVNRRMYYVTSGDGSDLKEGFDYIGNIKPEKSVPICADGRFTHLKAAFWALHASQFGKTTWDGNSLEFIREAYSKASDNIIQLGFASPIEFWEKETQDAKHTADEPQWKNPPRGAIVIWGSHPNYKDGHAALSLGNGWVVSTQHDMNTTGLHLSRIENIGSDSSLDQVYQGWISLER
jgi:hypothetical protein